MEVSMEEEKGQRLMEFFRVMGNEQRLKLAVYLMDHESSVKELAEQFGMKEYAVLENLAALCSLNLVTVRDQKRYSFDVKALYALNREVLARKELPTPIDHLEEEERKLLRPFFEGDRLIEFPVNVKKFNLLLKWLCTQFEVGVRYNEKQVNEIITRYHEDYATLRRAMIDENLMQREKGVYWRVGGE
jgi:hypothetical protein